ncbi:hypothetical protein B0H19DRAFT_1185595, partial [Mycena capillaripes]
MTGFRLYFFAHTPIKAIPFFISLASAPFQHQTAHGLTADESPSPDVCNHSHQPRNSRSPGRVIRPDFGQSRAGTAFGAF